MKILFITTTEGYGHVARTKAIVQELEKQNIEYNIMTDKKRADFLKINRIDESKINSKFYGIKYIYKKRAKRNLNIPLTTGKLFFDTPRYILDYKRVLSNVYKEKYDLVINDINLQFTRLPFKKVINITHYKCAKINDLKRLFRSKESFAYEGFLEPMINIPLALSNKFIMDLRSNYIDYNTIFPPIVSKITKEKEKIRKELNIKSNEKLVVDGRGNPPIQYYKKIAKEHSDIKFLVRSDGKSIENIYSKKFIPSLVNYVNAADLYINYPGFSSIGEGMINNTKMLFSNPRNHLEQLKNMYIAKEEGLGREIKNIELDILNSIDEKKEFKNTKNGLDYLYKMVFDLKQIEN